MCPSLLCQMNRSPSLLRQLLCRRWIWHQLSPLLVFAFSLLLLFHVTTIRNPRRYEESQTAQEAPTPGLPQREGASERRPGGRVERVAGAEVTEKPPPPPPPPLQRLPSMGGSWANPKQWMAYPRAVVAEGEAALTGARRVTLATQASLDRLALLPELVSHWDGPVSVALFTPDVEHPLAAAFVAYLRRCHAVIRQRVTFSLLVPVNRPPRPLGGSGQFASSPCGATRETLSSVLRRRPASVTAWRQKIPYPQNTLRNLARNASLTEFVWVVDVDVVPVAGAASALNEFLASRAAHSCGRCVFVVPTYEVDERERFPESAERLLELVRKKRARPFHEKVLIHNQFATNHSR
ncbi:Beta-1,4-glucuronyltransferase 1 [Amphibalanus amphitrite]|uniref:Beta-1,4-glucuronyltransferase 1 n=1 Tax=Amphibalanus amphitrite TaxID=1232801 RepID=A0A6A4WYR1_AMPAM|nr:Beta-1,4-glucuronyltransferase 1 [Amphibalanus amphitrite]